MTAASSIYTAVRTCGSCRWFDEEYLLCTNWRSPRWHNSVAEDNVCAKWRGQEQERQDA